MPTPSTRTPVRIARGSYSNLNGSVSDLHDGEISYAEDQNTLYIKEGTSLVSLTFAPASPTFTGDVTFTGAANNVVFDASDNALEFADNAKATFGASLSIYHDGSNSYIDDTDTGNLVIRSNQINFNKYTGEALARFRADGNCELYYDNSSRFATTNTGATVSGRLLTDGVSMGDNEELLIGTGNDFKLRHDGTDNHLVSSNGDINIQVADTENAIIAKPNGAVELYHDNVKKFETQASGIDVTGTVGCDKIVIDGPYQQVAEALGALDINCGNGNYFTKTISANSTFTFSNAPSSGTSFAFTLELTHSSGTVTWPSSVKWNADTAPTLTAGKTHLFMFVTDDGGTRWRGSALVDYVN